MRVSYSALEARLEPVERGCRPVHRCGYVSNENDAGEAARPVRGRPGAGDRSRPLTGVVLSEPEVRWEQVSDLDSVLKYVEKDEDAGGVKLVIMNFND